MADPLFIYAGPSWAATSFPENPESTSLAREWNLMCIDVSLKASSTFDQLERISTCLQTRTLPVVWIYNDPLTVLESVTGKKMDEFVQDSSWTEIYRDVNAVCLERINELGVPVLLIGGHSDIYDCDHANITVGHASWQKWLAEASGMKVIDDIVQVEPADGGNYLLERCWGAEIIQRFLHFNQDVKAQSSIVDKVWDIYFFWEELQRRDWFFETHPNRKANIEFAQYLLPTIKQFLEDK
jgi:hypothetical protein